MRRAPAFTAAVVLTLTIGIGSATAIFGVVDATRLRPLSYPDADRLVAVVNDMPLLSMEHVAETVGGALLFKRDVSTGGVSSRRWARIGRNRVKAYHMVRNTASGGVLARLRFQPEGLLRSRVMECGVHDNVRLWSRLRTD